MHPIHVSEGIVLRKLSVGESNVLASILTSDLGLIRAAVRSARAGASKLRYGIEPFTVGRFSFVRGRHEWRLVGAEPHSRPLFQGTAAHRAVLGRIARLLLRLIPGVEPSPALYETLKDALEVLPRVPDSNVAGLECIVLLRMLFALGYVAQTPDLARFLDGPMTELLIADATERKASLIRTINASLHASGL